MSSVCPTTLWIFICSVGCIAQPPTEEVELFGSVKQSSLKWTSVPRTEWVEIKLKWGSETAVPVYQACASNRRRTLLSHWIDRMDAHHLLLDIVFAQEEEPPSNQRSPLQVHLIESDAPLSRFRDGGEVLDLHASRQFSDQILDTAQISNYQNRRLGLNLGPIDRRGFHLGFSYSGTCVFLASVRLYFKRCPGLVGDLSRFEATGAGAGPKTGFCVEGAVKVTAPVRECQVDGVWGPLQGECVCAPGHQQVDVTCQARPYHSPKILRQMRPSSRDTEHIVCRMGYYKPANESGRCHPCPPNSRTEREGAESCDCLHGYNRLPTDPDLLGCTKSPSAPVDVSVHRHNDTVLTLLWNPPHDLGGRRELMYDVQCWEKEGESSGQWEVCGQEVIFLPASAGLTGTAVNITGVNPHSDYSLSVRARNAISIHQGAAASSVATITIHRWKSPVIITLAPVATISDPQISPAPQQQTSSSPWLLTGVLLGGLLLLALIPAAVCAVRRKYTKLSPDLEVELLPIDPGVAYRRHDDPDPEPQPVNTVSDMAQMLDGLSDRLLASLKDVLVERNQLTLGKELGKGEFGSVYEGIFTSEEGVDIKVAVKTMRVGIHSQEDLHEFLREAEIMKTFDHDNVVKLRGVTLEREQDSPLPVPLVILPYMKHGDLRRFLIATRYGDIPMFVPDQSILRFMIDISAGMEYLSSQGFLHRDLAARNCMLGDDFRVCVADFGLSKKIYSSNYYRQKVAIRVPIKWMSIESLSESVYTTKSDVWSFGVTMWELVSRGRTPYPGVHNHELLDLLMSGHRLKQPDDCDPILYTVMQSCWHKDPSQRPGFMELGERLKALLSELPALEASQETHYINLGLEAAACQGDAQDYNPETERGAVGNIYLPTPMGAAPPAKREEEEGGSAGNIYPAKRAGEEEGGAVGNIYLAKRVGEEGGEEEGAVGNDYLPGPMGAPPPARRRRDEEEEEGYLVCTKSGSALKGDCHC